MGTKLRISRCNGNECRAKDSVANEVPLLKHRDHMAAGNRWAGLATIDHGDGLVAIWVEFLAGWAQGHQAAPLEGLDKLPQGQLHAAGEPFKGLALQGEGHLEAVGHRQHGLGKPLNGKFTGIGEFLGVAFAKVVDFSRKPNELVLSLGEQRRSINGRPVGAALLLAQGR